MKTAQAREQDQPSGEKNATGVQRRGFNANAVMVGVNRYMPWVFSGPAIIVISVIMAFPVIYTLYQSLFAISPFQAEQPFVGLQNYIGLTQESLFWASMRRTFVYVLSSVVMGTVLAVIFGFSLSKLVGGLRWVRAFVIFPYIVSSIAVAVMFRLVFNTDFGVANSIIETFGFDGISWLGQSYRAMFVVILANVWSDLPLPILIVFGGLQTIDSSYLDAAAVDGANGAQRAWHVSMPLIVPQITLAGIFFSYRAATSLGTILALTGGGPGQSTEMLTLMMLNAGFREFNTSKGFALAIVLFLINAALVLTYLRMQRRVRGQV